MLVTLLSKVDCDNDNLGDFCSRSIVNYNICLSVLLSFTA